MGDDRDIEGKPWLHAIASTSRPISQTPPTVVNQAMAGHGRRGQRPCTIGVVKKPLTDENQRPAVGTVDGGQFPRCLRSDSMRKTEQMHHRRRRTRLDCSATPSSGSGIHALEVREHMRGLRSEL